MKIQRALISVSDKTGIVEFARALHQRGVEILSTGGTARSLQAENIPTVEVSQFTGSPEIMDGRVKTLHPKIHGGLLYLRGNDEHEKQAKTHGIRPIDLVVVNLYPFEATIAKEGVTLPEAIEQIDIGGPSMIRSAAKNYQSVAVVTDPADYPAVLEDMEENHGGTDLALRERLAIKAFATTASYDRTIAGFLNREQETSAAFRQDLPLELRLRYGENPHQQAELYGDFGSYFEKLQGKELSYNNILDISAA
ncbi:MAG: bifunctional phosphoribosylaminoimidazolecarboxamide formyltransferase/IMP cyclohydrolase, partial [Terrimicrobiaceae bacterium]